MAIRALLICSLAILCTLSSADNRTAAVQLVLYGSTGSLASKYLWQAVLEVADALYPARLLVVATAREEPVGGLARVRSLLDAASCGAPLGGAQLNASAAAAACARLKRVVSAQVQYVSLRGGAAGSPSYSLDPTAALVAAAEAGAQDPRLLLVARVLYMAVAPAVAQPLLEAFASHAEGGHALRTSHRGFPTRVVLEKPLGRDAESAAELLAGVGVLADPGCVLIADHYLGKAGVAALGGLRSRLVNDARLGAGGEPPAHALEAEQAAALGVPAALPPQSELWLRLLTTLHYSEVVLLEEERVGSARAGFYNEQGVLRDVMQSHMSVLAAGSLLLPGARWDAPGREAALKSMAQLEAAGAGAGDRPGGGAGLLAPHRFGAYAGYAQEAGASAGEGFPLGTLPEESPAGSGAARAAAAAAAGRSLSSSETWGGRFLAATAAQVVLSGLGVPLVFTSGKALGARSAYVRQLFAPALPPPARCGPVSMTYHLAGALALPPGGEAEAWAAPLAAARAAAPAAPALALTGFCGEAVEVGLLPDPRALVSGGYEAPDWPGAGAWNLSWDRHSGVAIALLTGLPASPALSPTLGAWRAREMAVAGGVGAGDGDALNAVDVERDPGDLGDPSAPTMGAAAARAALLPPPGAPDSALVPVSPGLLRARLRALIAGGGSAGGDAYRTLLAAALEGDASRFSSPGEVAAAWALWAPLAALGDETMATGAALHWGREDLQGPYARARGLARAAAREARGEASQAPSPAPGAPFAEEEPSLLYVHAPGDRSWLRALPQPLPLPRRLGAPRAPPPPPPALPGAGVLLSSKAPGGRVRRLSVEAVVARGPFSETSSQFAADAAALLWDASRAHASPFVHWALDAGPEMAALLDRWPSMDVAAAVPWQALHLWPVAERRSEASAPDCNLCFLSGAFAARVRLPEDQLHGLMHPNVSHINGLAAAALAAGDGGFDLVSLRVPGARAAEGPGGLGLAEALSEEKELRRGLTREQLKQAAAARRAPAAPPAAPPDDNRLARGMPDFSAVPPRTLIPYLGAIDIRMSPHAIATARHVWVVVPESRVTRAVHWRGDVMIAADGSAPAGTEGNLRINTLAGIHFPRDLVDDIVMVVGEERMHPVRLYVVEGV